MRIIYTDTTGAGYTRDEVALSAKILSVLKTISPAGITHDLCLGLPLTDRLKRDLEAAKVIFDEKVAKVMGRHDIFSAFSVQSEHPFQALKTTWVTASALADLHTYEELEAPDDLNWRGVLYSPDRVTPSAGEATMASLRECAARSAAAIDAKKDIQARIAQAVSQGLRATPLPSHATQELRDWLRKSHYQFNHDETEIWW